jgi:dienelactone hydrolase
MYMRPGQVSWQAPDYVKKAAFQTRDVTVGTDEWKLPGTLTIPVDKRPVPAIVLVSDAGPVDRDGTVSAIKPFRDLAEGLSSRGIAVLRYENRKNRYAAKIMGSSYTIDDEVVHDALAAIALLRAQPEIDKKRIYVLGLGTGGFIAPQIAADDGNLSGVIILSAPGRALEDWFVEFAQSMGTTGKQFDLIKQEAQKVKKIDASDADQPPLFQLPVSYWLNLKGYDAPAELKKLTIPALILQGGRDFQVAPAEFDVWKSGLSGRTNVTLKSYPAMNHLFIAGEGKSSEQEYRKPAHIAPEVIDDIAKFVNP